MLVYKNLKYYDFITQGVVFMVGHLKKLNVLRKSGEILFYSNTNKKGIVEASRNTYFIFVDPLYRETLKTNVPTKDISNIDSKRKLHLNA